MYTTIQDELRERENYFTAEENLSRLREILSSLHYSVAECDHCGRIDHYEKYDRLTCVVCEHEYEDRDICDECLPYYYVDSLNGYCCWKCIDERAQAEREEQPPKKKIHLEPVTQ